MSSMMIAKVAAISLCQEPVCYGKKSADVTVRPGQAGQERLGKILFFSQ
jgi:hypothetical protein